MAESASMVRRHLQAAGYEVVARNYRCRSGEIDIVATREGQYVFVEVKERTNERQGTAIDSVTFGKRRRIVRAARMYAASRGLMDSSFRFDVIAVDWQGTTPSIRHDTNAFDMDGG